MNAWIFAGACLAIYLAGACFFGTRARNRNIAELLERRANPSREAFIALMAVDARKEVSAFLWDELQVYYLPELAPHPDDDLIDDLLIDPEEPGDWIMEYCRRRGASWRLLPDWPQGEANTPRNIGRYLSALPH